MTDFTDLVFGVILWLGSGTFLITLFNGKPPSENESFSNSLDANSESVDKSDSGVVLPETQFIKKTEIKTLEEQIAKKNQALISMKEEIFALQSELEITSDALESSQDKYFQLNQDFQEQVNQLTDRILYLEAKNSQLNENNEILSLQVTQKIQEECFEQLQSLLTNYPTAKMMVKFKPELAAKNVIALLKPLDNLLSYWQINTIGKPWQKVNFNPQLHQADCDEINEGDLVYIRFVGYSQQTTNHVLVKAKVSRFLPGQN